MGKFEKIGIWAFYIGLIITIIIALLPEEIFYSSALIAVIILLGLVVGFLNIQDKEINSFLLSSIALLLSLGAIIGFVSLLPLGEKIANVLRGLVIFISPGAVVVSIKSFFNIAKS